LLFPSGSACTSASLEPSYVAARFGTQRRISAQLDPFQRGRFTTMEEVDYVIALLKSKIGKLRELSPLWEMYQDGIDLNTVQWAAH